MSTPTKEFDQQEEGPPRVELCPIGTASHEGRSRLRITRKADTSTERNLMVEVRGSRDRRKAKVQNGDVLRMKSGMG